MKFILEINEKPYTPYGNRFTELKLVRSLNIFLFQRFTVLLADGFIAISENLKDYLNQYVDEKKIIKIPILIDPTEVHNKSPKLNLEKPYLLHAGALSDRKDGIIGVFEAFAIANRKVGGNLHFYLTEKVAPTDVHNSIQKIIKRDCLEGKVHFLGLISKQELLTYQKECSMLIVNKPDNIQNRYNFPTKLGEYLALGKPVIYTPVGEMTNFLKDGINAFEVPVANPKAIADAILKILVNDSSVKGIAVNGLNLAETVFNYQVQGKRLANFLKNLRS